MPPSLTVYSVQQTGKQHAPASCCKPSQAASPIHTGLKPVYRHSSQPRGLNLPRSDSCYLNPIYKRPVDAAQSRPVSPAPHLRPTPHQPGLALLPSALGGSRMLGLSFGFIPISRWGCTVLDATAAVPVSRHTPKAEVKLTPCRVAVSAGSRTRWAYLLGRRVEPGWRLPRLRMALGAPEPLNGLLPLWPGEGFSVLVAEPFAAIVISGKNYLSPGGRDTAWIG